MTLLSILTFDNWGDVLYTNYYGCDTYGVKITGNSVLFSLFPSRTHILYAYPRTFTGLYTNDPNSDMRQLGGLLYCANPTNSDAFKILTIVYFFTFVVLGSFCILSMFIGAVMMSMIESMVTLQETSMRLMKAAKKKK